MIDLEGRVKLVDFGFAKRIHRERTFTLCGTLHSMAPEFFTEEGTSNGIDYSVDYYSIGILAYELLRGHPPFGYEDQEDSSKIIGKIKAGVDRKEISENFDVTTSDFLCGLLAKNSKDRLGYNTGGWTSVLKHAYFGSLDMETLRSFVSGTNSVSFFKDIARYGEDIEFFGCFSSFYSDPVPVSYTHLTLPTIYSV
eukprot:TRINITY_DN10991_c0_g1_i1.p1 TRINITY_DN10991_c0_g1~~TRINITY_DN10991_c0_g1_i1.p1  ORF type:complete len:196 (-),score=25.96 TRINITY_DN10991_c0_g1_i1:29-616(-)